MAMARFQIYRKPGAGVMWRFLSANNRSIGQAPSGFADVTVCARAVLELRERLGDTAMSVTRDGTAQLWTWRVRLGGVDLAVSTRRYQRRVQATYAGRSFVELVAGTPASEMPQVMHFTVPG